MLKGYIKIGPRRKLSPRRSAARARDAAVPRERRVNVAHVGKQLRARSTRDLFRESARPGTAAVDGCRGLAVSADDIKRNWTGENQAVRPTHQPGRVRRGRDSLRVTRRTTGTAIAFMCHEDSRSKTSAIAEKFGRTGITPTGRIRIRDGRAAGGVRRADAGASRRRDREKWLHERYGVTVPLSGRLGREHLFKAGIRRCESYFSRPAVCPS